jgi:hypothetical protein
VVSVSCGVAAAELATLTRTTRKAESRVKGRPFFILKRLANGGRGGRVRQAAP